MEVTLKINTEKEDLNELKKLQTWVSELIAKRENTVAARIEQQKKEEENKAQKAAAQQLAMQQAQQQKSSFQPVQQQPKKEYSGSGKIIDYEDMSDMMSNIYSGGRL